MICQFCSTNIPSSAASCPGCGGPVSSGASSPSRTGAVRNEAEETIARLEEEVLLRNNQLRAAEKQNPGPGCFLIGFLVVLCFVYGLGIPILIYVFWSHSQKLRVPRQLLDEAQKKLADARQRMGGGF